MAGNDFEAACAKFDDRLTFATGVDVQQGEWMTPAELRAGILRNYGPGPQPHWSYREHDAHIAVHHVAG